MKAFQIAKNVDFQVIAMVEAFKMISKGAGISIDSLVKQFSEGNENLINRVGELVAMAAKVTADELSE